MASRHVGKAVFFAGGLGIVGSLVWWHTFYTDVFQFLGTHDTPPLECIYSLGGPCGMVQGTAAMFGATAYDPKVFWASCVVFVVGLFLVNTPSDYKEGFSPSKPKGADRRDPTL